MANSILYPSKFRSINDAICYWLGYQFKIGRQQLVHEASLRYPISDALTATALSVDQIELEKLHPVFKSKKIDLVTYKDTKSKASNNLCEIYEFKLAKAATDKKGKSEHQRVFNDVVRLAYIHKQMNLDCYFLMCGKKDDFAAFFVRQKTNTKVTAGAKQTMSQNKISQKKKSDEMVWESEGLYKNWFDFKYGGVKNVIFNQSATNVKSMLDKFQSKYKIRKNQGMDWSNEKSIKIRTTCVAITTHAEAMKKTHAAGLWKIEYVN